MGKHCDIGTMKGFEVLLESPKSQAASMALEPGESTGGPDNKHKGSDQWMYVLSGVGEILIKGQCHSLKAKRLVLIEAGETHEVKNTGTEKLETLNIYAPPEY